MDSFQGDQNCQFFVVLAESVGALLISLLERARSECPLMLESFRRTLLPVHRAMADFLGQQPPFESHQLHHSAHLRDASANPFRTLPSLHHHFYPRNSPLAGAGWWPTHNVTPPDDITPPPTPSHQQGWPQSPLGYTSTPFRAPPVIRPRPDRFALINQLLTAMRTSEDSVARVTDQYAHDPIFRARMLTELDELRTLVDARPERATSGAAGQAISTLLGRVEQAEITLSSLIRNLQQLEHSTLQTHLDLEETNEHL
uniref:Uncharacterized protein n=1 Tax=Anopheles atroparvus TaxID=41427 RepID=A0AAG5DDV5_ANOAO